MPRVWYISLSYRPRQLLLLQSDSDLICRFPPPTPILLSVSHFAVRSVAMNIAKRRSVAVSNPSFILYAWSVLLLSLTLNLTNASIHFYDKETFIDVGNAYLLSGGSEGLAASLPANSDAPSLRNGQSFIQYSF